MMCISQLIRGERSTKVTPQRGNKTSLPPLEIVVSLLCVENDWESRGNLFVVSYSLSDSFRDQQSAL